MQFIQQKMRRIQHMRTRLMRPAITHKAPNQRNQPHHCAQRRCVRDRFSRQMIQRERQRECACEQRQQPRQRQMFPQIAPNHTLPS